MGEKYLLHCKNDAGRRTPPIEFDDAESVVRQAARMSKIFPEVFVTDAEDNTVLHAMGGAFVFPKLSKKGECECGM